MRRVVISHFFNEAYMLTWWLRHHREIFDHGVLIDYASTDASVDICRELVPGWEIIPSENAQFSAILCDFEVMKHEQRFSNTWKIVLNTTEFLVAPKLNEMEQFVIEKDLTGVQLPGAIMVDTELTAPPDPSVPLVQQKNIGVWENMFDFSAAHIPGLVKPLRNRLYHHYTIGAYAPGRHISLLPGQIKGSREFGAIWWYGYSPWTDAFQSRKLGIAAKRDSFDKKHRLGIQHEVSLVELNVRWSKMVAASSGLARLRSVS